MYPYQFSLKPHENLFVSNKRGSFERNIELPKALQEL